MPEKEKQSIRPLVVAGSVIGSYLLARNIAYAQPDPDTEARADAAAHSGPWTHGFKVVDGVRLHYAEIGSGPLVILLHGFPECWYTWHNILPRMATQFHVVVPDMRGYNWSEKPFGVENYTVEAVSEDIVALIRSFGEEAAFLAGHDWGGVVAWHLGMRHPELIKKLCVINAPHPQTMARELRKPDQIRRSTYALFFQLPLLPEASVRLSLRRALRGSAFVPGTFSDEALDVYQNGYSQPGAATAMLNYYRAVGRNPLQLLSTESEPVLRPTLVVWGMKDLALSPRLLDGLEEYVPDLRIERIEDSGHWVPEEKPRALTDLLVEFFSD